MQVLAVELGENKIPQAENQSKGIYYNLERHTRVLSRYDLWMALNLNKK